MRYKYPKYWKDHLAQVAKNDHNPEGNQYSSFILIPKKNTFPD